MFSNNFDGQPMWQTNDALMLLCDLAHALAGVIGTLAVFYICLAVFDHEGVLSSEERKLAVHVEGIFCDHGVLMQDSNALSVRGAAAQNEEEQNAENQQCYSSFGV